MASRLRLVGSGVAAGNSVSGGRTQRLARVHAAGASQLGVQAVATTSVRATLLDEPSGTRLPRRSYDVVSTQRSTMRHLPGTPFLLYVICPMQSASVSHVTGLHPDGS